MPSLCERCPVVKKAAYCCRSNPDTGKSKYLRNQSTGLRIAVCINLQQDGSCGIYQARPEACKGYDCEEHRELGLGSYRERVISKLPPWKSGVFSW